MSAVLKEHVHTSEVDISLEFRRQEQRQMIHLLRSLTSVVGKVNFYATNESDEFQVKRGEDQVDGIFKTWSVPVIPFLETGTLSYLERTIPELTSSGKISDLQRVILEGWAEKYRQQPAALAQVLEKWRGFAEVYDRRLYEIFSKLPLPENKVERISELFLRLKVAFGMAAPFYHLEAMVAQSEESPLNPFSQGAQEKDSSPQKSLDLVGMLLPSALREFITARELDWQNLDWALISKQVEQIKVSHPEEAKILFQIARKLGVTMEEVLFAANVLQWIPVSVAGKKDDLAPADAQLLIQEALKPKEMNLENVAAETNSLIRLYNWFPLTKGAHNFGGDGWRYAAACDTTNQLMAAVQEGGAFTPEFEQHFHEVLLPQLQHTDATSAKGRFLLQLLEEGHFQPNISTSIEKKKVQFLMKTSWQLTEKKLNESVLALEHRVPRFLGGGKVAGLQESAMIFGEEKVLKGCFITSEAIESLLKTDSQLWTLIQNLEFGIFGPGEDEFSLATKIQERILGLSVPPELINKMKDLLHYPHLYILRSSSFDEDNDQKNTAAGIYESVGKTSALLLPSTLKQVIASFFSHKAVSYRLMTGSSHFPMFSVSAHEHLSGPGGAVLSQGDGTDWIMEVGSEPSAIVGSEKDSFDSHSKRGNKIESRTAPAHLTSDEINEIDALTSRAVQFTGDAVDMEFISHQGKIVVLQRRTFFDNKPKRNSDEQGIQPQLPNTNLHLESLGELASFSIPEHHVASLYLSESINLDQFQGELLRWLVRNRNKVHEVHLQQEIPMTGHFANICSSLGIEIMIKK
jgi:hypothetical protein